MPPQADGCNTPRRKGEGVGAAWLELHARRFQGGEPDDTRVSSGWTFQV